MDQVHVVRHKVLIEKLSQRQVALDLGLSRNTVAKYLSMPEPVRQALNPRSAPLRLLAASRIEQLLDEWRDRTTPKQRITGTRLHRQLREEGLPVGKTTVYEILREKRLRSKEVFIPLLYQAADCAQVDFFEVTVEINSLQRKAWKFLMRLMYSGYDFVFLYDACDQLSFLDAHVRAFSFLGGVPQRLVYDNLSAAVRLRAGLHSVEEITFTRQGGEEVHPRLGRGAKSIRYRHYLSELARKPQAVRQVSPKLIEELGEPFGKLWELLYQTHGGLEAARTLARLLGVINKHDEQSVRALLEQAMRESTPSPAPHEREQAPPTLTLIEVPESLRGYEVERSSAADYDHLLVEGGAV